VIHIETAAYFPEADVWIGMMFGYLQPVLAKVYLRACQNTKKVWTALQNKKPATCSAIFSVFSRSSLP